MPGNLSFDDLRQAAERGEIDTVVAAQVDMQGRLMGKRFHVSHFLDSAHEETHSCDYLLATDFEMDTVGGYAATSWASGYGDHTMRPDMTTLRETPWLEGTALVLCDVEDHATHAPVPHSPRAVLKRQVERLAERGFEPVMASELEFFLFREPYEEAQAAGFRGLTLSSPFNEDYNVFQTTREEQVLRAVRNGLFEAGIPVECSKGEASAGQEEINVRYAGALEAADNHAILKNGVKEIAWGLGRSVTFMAKWNEASAGSSSHIHQSLRRDGEPAFFDADGDKAMSKTMRHYLAGLIAHAAETTLFLAPNVNSYKRFKAGTFAPTRSVWSTDNRTAGFRICGAGTPSVRVENRIGGADLNPYLAFAAQLAAGLKGIEEEMELGEEFSGDAYGDDDAPHVPRTLREAIDAADGSPMLREAFGDGVMDHYVHAARHEQAVFDAAVTDWEVRRGFEQS